MPISTSPTHYDPNHRDQPIPFRVGQKVVILNQQNQVLVIRRSEKMSRPGGWDFPGGGLDREDPESGILREIKEETELSVTELQSVVCLTQDLEKESPMLIIGYRARATSTVVQLSWEHDQFKWVDLPETKQLNLPEMHQQILAAAVKSTR